MSAQTQQLLRAMLAEPNRPWYGREISAATGLLTGTTSPILARLEDAGWLKSWWEDTGTHAAAGRPRRRYYQFTEDGAERAHNALAQVVYKTKPKPRVRAVPGEVFEHGGLLGGLHG